MRYDELIRWMRGMRFPRRYRLKNKELIAIKIEDIEFALDTYLGIFGMKDVGIGRFDTVLLDIDGNSLDESYEKFKIVVKKLNGLEKRCYFTGRGFHIYLDFEELYLEKIQYKHLCFDLIREYGIDDYVDLQVVGDVNRVARIPFSYNSKTGLLCIPIKEDWGKLKIKSLSKDLLLYMDYYENEDWDAGKNNFDDYVKEFKMNSYDILKEVGIIDGEIVVDKYFEKVKGDMSKYPPCIQNIYNRIVGGGEVEHYERIHFASFILKLEGFERCMEYFRNGEDFDERYCRYQLEWLLRKKYNCFSCEGCLRLGICRDEWYEDCPFKPSLNSWVRWRNDDE